MRGSIGLCALTDLESTWDRISAWQAKEEGATGLTYLVRLSPVFCAGGSGVLLNRQEPAQRSGCLAYSLLILQYCAV